MWISASKNNKNGLLVILPAIELMKAIYYIQLK